MAPEIIAALVGAGATAAAGIGSGIQAGKLNKKNRQWQEKMYNKQFYDSVIMQDRQNAYNKQLMEEEFKRNAEYNSPVAQIARYQEAGLNPNLAYGSVGGETSLQYQPSADAEIPSAGSAPYQASMQFDMSPLMSAMSQFVDLKAKKDLTDAQARSVELQNIDKEKELKYKYGGDLPIYDSEGNYIGDTKRPGLFDYQLGSAEHTFFSNMYHSLQDAIDVDIKRLQKDIYENQKNMSNSEKKLLDNRLEQAEYMKDKLDSIFKSNKSTSDKLMDMFELFIFNTISSSNFNAFNIR